MRLRKCIAPQRNDTKRYKMIQKMQLSVVGRNDITGSLICNSFADYLFVEQKIKARSPAPLFYL